MNGAPWIGGSGCGIIRPFRTAEMDAEILSRWIKCQVIGMRISFIGDAEVFHFRQRLHPLNNVTSRGGGGGGGGESGERNLITSSSSQTNRFHQRSSAGDKLNRWWPLKAADQWPSKAAGHVTPGGGVGQIRRRLGELCRSINSVR